MPFTYAPITPTDRERLEALNIVVRHHKVHSHESRWTVNRETGDFLIRIIRDREPPHYNWFALWWRDQLYCVELNDSKTSPATGYHVEIAGIAAISGEPIPRSDRPALSADLFEAVRAYAIGDATELFAGLRMRKKPPPDPAGVPALAMRCTLNDLSKSPHAIFATDFPKDVV